MTPDAATALMAVCASCPALAAAAGHPELIPLMDEHFTKTGHRLWALSAMTHSRRTDEPARDDVGA